MPNPTTSQVLEELRVGKGSPSNIFETAHEAYNLGRRAYLYWQRKMRWTVTVNSDDRLYDLALKWFLSEEADTNPPRAIKATYVYGSAGRRRPGYADLDDIISSRSRGAKPEGRVELSFNENSTRQVVINGHKIAVLLERADRGGDDEGRRTSLMRPDQLHFYASSEEGQQVVVEHLRQLAADSDKRKPALQMLDTWGSWTRRDDLPTRDLSSVVLRAGQMERLRDDLQSFIDQEPDYVRRGVPYHRGYMLYGPPGTGKTSIVRALAAHFGLDLWFAPLGDLDKDTSLMSLVNQVQPGSILLLEDVDVYHATRNRDDAERGASMAGLLNSLDGVATPHGLITFMTTNDVSVIDPALLRPGRIDVVEEIGHPDNDQIARLYESWYGTALTPQQIDLIKWTGTTAALAEVFKQNLNDADAAWLVLQKKNTDAEKRSVRVLSSGGTNERRQGKREGRS